MNVKELIRELSQLENQEREVFFFHDGDITQIKAVDGSISDRVDLQ